ncbi:MAG: uroporphyrinogen decarboxylase family protein, partial [Candidatus Hodarchaeota archaeon]
IKPCEAEFASRLHRMVDVKINYHCCGSAVYFIPDFIEMGYDSLNPVQVTAEGMDPCSLKQRHGDEMVFWGGVCNTQGTLPFGTPDQVRDEVRYNVGCLKKGGGFVAANIHNITYDVPPENIVAMFDAINEFGYY